MNICIFCSARNVGQPFEDDARGLASSLAAAGHTLVWGGSDTGLMKVCADAAQAAGGKIIGISMERLRDKARHGADEMIITETLAERKALLLSRSDIIVALVGGIGTLDELLEVLELKKHALHSKPVIVLNTAGFYDGLRTQIETMNTSGFLSMPLEQLVTFASTQQEVMSAISQALQ